MSEQHDSKIYQLEGCIKAYPWGMTDQCLIRSFIENHPVTRTNNDETIMAELWFGHHVNGSHRLFQYDASRHKFTVESSMKTDNSFLSKILSINQPLSIQVHPDKQNAVELNKEKPNIYKDANSKAEMSISLSDRFILLYDIMEPNLLREHFSFLKITEYILADVTNQMNCNVSIVRKWLTMTEYQCKDMYADILNKKDNFVTPYQVLAIDWFCRFYNLYGLEAGIFASFIMNIVVLKKFEAVYISPGTLHAYLSGECIEVQENSDNVVRAGLTKKLKDTPLLLKILSNETKKLNVITKGNDMVFCYTQNIENVPFVIYSITLASNESYSLDRIQHLQRSCQIFVFDADIQIIEQSQTHSIRKNSAYFIENISNIIVKANNTPSYVAVVCRKTRLV